MKRAGTTTGYYAVRTHTGNLGWAFYTDNRLARMRAAAEGHRCVTWMTRADADFIIDKMGGLHA
jgi:hypothetical protein